MSETVIKVEGLGKKYIIGHQEKGGYKTLRDQIGDSFKTVISKTKRMLSGQMLVEGDEMEEFWALRDVSFEVKQGDRLGIIGRNGAGKSTLLKILSRITEPTMGRVMIKGRAASLLEVGTGFHPELSGRENIFLNGAILGMSRAEIKRKFDEIVAFSGVEKFLDTPVKRFSSGMYVRLAFSVAAHLEPEILIVDEVLAVGDAEFQKKCLGKMNEISDKDGRTILFVSHNMQVMQRFCNKGILLQNGVIKSNDSMQLVVNEYLNTGEALLAKKTFKVDESKSACIIAAEILNEKGEATNEIQVTSKWKVKVVFEVLRKIEDLICGIGLVNPLELPLNTSWQKPQTLEVGRYCAEFKQNDIMYGAGLYKIHLGLSSGGQTIQFIEEALRLNILPILNDVEIALIRVDASTSAILNQSEMKTYRI